MWPSHCPGCGRETKWPNASLSFVPCPDCPATKDGRGHHVMICTCRATMYPPGCGRALRT